MHKAGQCMPGQSNTNRGTTQSNSDQRKILDIDNLPHYGKVYVFGLIYFMKLCENSQLN